MKSTQGNLSLSVLTLAVRSALAVMAVMPLAAMADDAADAAAAAAAQAAPTNTIEVGGVYTTKDSAKFGEYNGLNKKGVDLDASLSLKGGDAYGQGTGTHTWSITGRDLGTTSRELGVAASDQGTWKVSIDYDQLQHNIDDTYQTPYQGTMGGNNFTLPPAFGIINSATKPSPANDASGMPLPYGARNLTASQLAAFHQQDVYSKRENTSLKAGYNFDPQLGLTFDWKHIDQSGAKLIGSGTDNLVNVLGTWGNEKVAILMNPTVGQTDNVNLALNWKGDKAFGSVGYYGSLYRDKYDGLSWSNPWLGTGANGTNVGALPVNSMATPPSNQFHQLNLTGGYHVSSATKVVGGVSYARNTQNESFAGTFTPGDATPPGSSLNASVTMKHADLKLTNRTTDALDLSAGVVYNERDNHTTSQVYPFTILGGEAATPVNIPESWKHAQFDLGADYRIDSRQRLHAGYNYDKFERWCDGGSAALYATGSVTPSSVIAPYGSPTSCAQVPKQTTNGLDLDYKISVSEALRVKAGYAYSNRSSTVNSIFYSPLHSFAEGYENQGFLAFFQASRTENSLKLSSDWQVSDKLDVELSGKYAKDDYGNSTFGVQQGTQGSINLDATYTVSENETVNAYVTQQHRTRDMTNANGRLAVSIAPGTYINDLKDDQLMLGLGSKQKGLMAGKLSLSEDLTYSLGKTDYSAGVGGTNTCGAINATPGTGSAATLTTNCTNLPTIKSGIATLKLTGNYQVSKPAKVVMAYQYQHMNVSDPLYYGDYQYGYVSGSGTLPTYQQAPNYNVSVFYLGYAYSFQ